MPLVLDVTRTVLGDHRLGVDVIALIAMAGALALGEYFAGAVIALMFSGGQALEAEASRRARRELTALVQRAPKIAHRRTGEALVEVPVTDLDVGDVVLVRTGEVVPVGGAVVSAEAMIDESALTGESLPVTRSAGEHALSGTANAGTPFELRATRPAAESAYAALVRLVESAERSRAPFVRMADRYATLFLPLTLLAAGAAWAVSGDPVLALAVVVVATPCPLILAAPIMPSSPQRTSCGSCALHDDRELGPVVMVGDSVNDAPALALADVGIAMGAAGATIAAESADAVITVDRVSRVAEAVAIGRRSTHIATQSVLAGMGLEHRGDGFRRRRRPGARRRRPVAGRHRPRRGSQCPPCATELTPAQAIGRPHADSSPRFSRTRCRARA